MLIKIFKNFKGIAGLSIIMLYLLVVVLSSWISPYDPYAQKLTRRLKPPGWTSNTGETFILGTDHVGRDILSRVIYGARVSMLVGILAVLFSGILGILLGCIAGYTGGYTETVIMRITDMQLSMPLILIAIAWLAFMGSSLANVIIVIAFWMWTQYCRVARGMVLSLKEKDFVEATRAVGGSNFYIIRKHIFPNVIGTMFTIATLQLGRAILLESTLSFLGVGVQLPTPTWGVMLSSGRAYIDTSWWLATFPGLAIMIFVLGANLFGDALRDIYDPKGKK